MDGLAVCTATGSQSNGQVVSDGEGGAVVTWLDFRNGLSFEIHSQRVDASGALLWEADGTAVSIGADRDWRKARLFLHDQLREDS